MATYLYGLLLADSPRPDAAPAGIGGAPVRVLECGDLAALVSDLDGPAARTTGNGIAHDHVLRDFVGGGATVCAARFGQVFESDAACRDEVRARSARTAVRLREVNGCVEMRVLLTLGQADAVAPEQRVDAGEIREGEVGPGSAYLLALRGARRVTTVALRDALGPLVREERVEELEGGRAVALAHLIQRDDEQAYRDAVAAMPALAAGVVSGPNALYTFAEAE